MKDVTTIVPLANDRSEKCDVIETSNGVPVWTLASKTCREELRDLLLDLTSFEKGSCGVVVLNQQTFENLPTDYAENKNRRTVMMVEKGGKVPEGVIPCEDFLKARDYARGMDVPMVITPYADTNVMESALRITTKLIIAKLPETVGTPGFRLPLLSSTWQKADNDRLTAKNFQLEVYHKPNITYDPFRRNKE